MSSGGLRSSRSTRSAQRRGLLWSHGLRHALRVAGTKENPGRRFWGCVYYEVQEHCDFFCWADKEQLEDDAENVKLRKKVLSLKTKVRACKAEGCCVCWVVWVAMAVLVVVATCRGKYSSSMVACGCNDHV
ncbi:hypothetical protein PIB30_070994 [Stylosanthes scabra]|uniref:GRF-type domain-containing protein n=1 Tax=Stylosanthes scabra TaxID=79078 RepID=A0ABU6YP67_9FABA|nr:hypothetical protein [Stylosanthes scabra]